MGRAVIALILILDVLVCPFACSGSISLGSDCSADPCCASKPTDPSDEPSRPGDDGCDGSCMSCLCGGAINADDSCADLMLAQDTVMHDWLPDLPAEVSTTTTERSQQIVSDDTIVLPSGVALRAILQSFLL